MCKAQCMQSCHAHSPRKAGWALCAGSEHRPLQALLLTGHLEVVVQRPGAGALRSLLEGSSKKAEAGAEIWMRVTGKDAC